MIFKNDFSNLALETKIKEIQDKFFDLNNKRNEIDKYGYSSLEILDIYSKLNQQLLDSIYSLKSIKKLLILIMNFKYFLFLSYKEQVGIERALISLAIIKVK